MKSIFLDIIRQIKRVDWSYPSYGNRIGATHIAHHLNSIKTLLLLTFCVDGGETKKQEEKFIFKGKKMLGDKKTGLPGRVSKG